MEPVNAAQEEEDFTYVATARQFDPDHARTGAYAARLNAGQSQRLFGPSTTLSVHQGDSIRFEVYGRYDQPKAAHLWPALVPLAASANESASAPDGRPTTRRGLWAKLAAGVSVAWALVPHVFGHAAEVPRASVTYQVYNQDSVLVDTQVRYLAPDAAEGWQQLVVGGQAGQEGYVVVSMQNASPRDVWFDDAAVRTTTQELVVQENHYDPWGQNLVDLEVAGTPNEVFQYSNKERVAEAGLEWVDHGARYYDAQLGRWHVPDPANQFASPYIGMGNNPVLFRDPDGQWIHLLIGAVVGGTINVITHLDKIKNFKDGAAAFGIGAVAGLVTAATGGAALAGTSISMASVVGGTITGATGAAFGGPIQGIGNSAYFGDHYSFKQWGTDILVGGIAGGIAGGISNIFQRIRTPGLPKTNIFTGKPIGEITVDPLQVNTFDGQEVPADYNGIDATIEGGQKNKIYSARELIRRSAEPGPYHNFPESFNDNIFQGEKIIKPNYYNVGKPGLSNTSILYKSPGTLNGVRGFYEIGTRPSISGKTEVIIHRFFRPMLIK